MFKLFKRNKEERKELYKVRIFNLATGEEEESFFTDDLTGLKGLVLNGFDILSVQKVTTGEFENF